MLAGSQHGHTQLEMRADRCGNRDGVDRRVREQIVEVRGRLHERKAPLDELKLRLVQIRDRRNPSLRRFREVPDQIGSPVSIADDADVRHSVTSDLKTAVLWLEPAALEATTVSAVIRPLTTLACVADYARWYACHDCVVGDVLCHYRSGADYRALPDRHTRDHGDVRTERSATLHAGPLDFPVCFGLQMPVGVRRTRVPIVCEHHSVSDEHPIFDSDSLANETV